MTCGATRNLPIICGVGAPRVKRGDFLPPKVEEPERLIVSIIIFPYPRLVYRSVRS
jgi:hypothetical protein